MGNAAHATALHYEQRRSETISLYRLIATLQEDIGGMDEQQLRYDPEAAGACLSILSSKIQCRQVDRDQPAVCDEIFTGRVALGQPCEGSQACADVAGRSVFCESPDVSSPMVCVAHVKRTAAHGKAGDACSFTCYEGETCDAAAPPPRDGDTPALPPQPDLTVCYRDDGLFCDAGVCAPLAAVGAPCDASDACRGTAFCNSMTGRCTAPQPEGSPCENDQECLSDSCMPAAGSMGEPDFTAPRLCSSAAAAIAAWCRRDFAGAAIDSTSPEAGTTDPGAGAP